MTPARGIDSERLREDVRALSEIGRADDLGIYRMAFTDAEMAARAWLERRLAEAGIAARRDGAGNVFGRIGPESGPAVVLGSHLDTVPGGGPLDGALGVLAGVECLRRVRETGTEIDGALEVVAFSDEEGRFGGPFGSRAVAGLLTPERIHQATDLDGVRLADAMARHGLDAMDALSARRSPKDVHAYLELHIEQGPVLDRMGCPIGLVERITGLFRWTARLIGEPDHAGTTPMAMRRDAFSGLAEFAGEIARILEEHGGDDGVATIGKVDLRPGSANVVPGRVEFSLDARDTEAETLAALADAFRRALSAIARRRQLMFEFDVVSEVEPVSCDAEVLATLASAADGLGVSTHRMTSGAAHDAQIIARIAPVGMVFVPSVGGRSHSPAEWTHWEDVVTGASLLLEAALRLARGT